MGAEQMNRIGLRRQPKQERSQQRLDDILAAASGLIAEKGAEALRMTDLALYAKVPIGSVYQYFPERAAVLRALFDRHATVIQQRTAEILAETRSLGEVHRALMEVIDWQYATYRDNPAYLGIWTSTETDRDLIRLNIAHSFKVADLIETALVRASPDLSGQDLQARTRLLVQCVGAVIRLAVASEEDLAARLLAEGKALLAMAIAYRGGPAF